MKLDYFFKKTETIASAFRIFVITFFEFDLFFSLVIFTIETEIVDYALEVASVNQITSMCEVFE